MYMKRLILFLTKVHFVWLFLSRLVAVTTKGIGKKKKRNNKSISEPSGDNVHTTVLTLTILDKVSKKTHGLNT